MALITKKQLVEECLERDTLKKIAVDWELDVRSNAGHGALASALMKKRSIKLEDVIEYTSKVELQKTCEWLEISQGGTKADLTERIFAKENGSEMDDFQLGQVEQDNTPQPKKKPNKKTPNSSSKGNANQANEVISYRHNDKRKNNPQVGMVDVAGDHDEAKKTWAYDPHIDPSLQFDSTSNRAQIENLIDDALDSGDDETMRAALEQLKRMQSPFLNWTGKAEGTSFKVDTVSLHVHERIDPATILAGLQKRLKDAEGNDVHKFQSDLFHAPFENLPLSEAVDFYKHDKDWSNRLIAGDSLLVMNSLLQKEGMAGQLQMIFLDPPYGIKYGSNFQPFVNKRDVKDRSDADLTQEPEMIKAFRDTWELGIHSYLTYIRDRIHVSKDLLSDSGSIFIQISDENVHTVRNLLDEVFGAENFVSQISFQKTGGIAGTLLGTTVDYLLWYAKNKKKVKYNQIFKNREKGDTTLDRYNKVLFSDFSKGGLKAAEIRGEQAMPEGERYRVQSIFSDGAGKDDQRVFNWRMGEFGCPVTGHWKTTPSGLDRLGKSGRLEREGDKLRYVRYVNDFPVVPIHDRWESIQIGTGLIYVVQTAEKVIERCINMTTDPGDLVFDPTCGSGTTAFVAEKLGRRWITCDTSRVSITIAKQRLMTASYDYFELKYPHEGLKGGFINKTVPHITLKEIANNPEIDTIYEANYPAISKALKELNKYLMGKSLKYLILEGGRKGETVDFSSIPSQISNTPSGDVVPVNALLEWEVPFDFPEDWPEKSRKFFDNFHAVRISMQEKMDVSIGVHSGQEVLYDQPEISKNKLRITGPFTVEAVPFATVLSLDEADQPKEANVAVARSGATSRDTQWREELLKAGIRGKGGQQIQLLDLTPLPDTKYIHAVGTLKETGEKVAISFGPEYAALEQRQVEIAMREASSLFPLPEMLVFCAFTFDPEAAKDIDNIKGISALKVQMNTDLLTEDLKKGRSSNESFWLMGQPDVEVRIIKGGAYQVEVHGFDYFDTKSGELKSGGKKHIAMWSLDTNYDNRSIFPQQVFFPMAGSKDGWNKLKKDIKAELDEDLMAQYHGTISVPFEKGDNECIAVKIVDDRGIESLKVIQLD